MRLTGLVAAAVMVLGAAATAEIKVTPKGHLTSLSDEQKGELFHALLDRMTPDAAVRATDGCVAVDRKDAVELTVTMSEDAPGEMGGDQIIAVAGNTVGEMTSDVKKGDGQVSGSAEIIHLSWGAAGLFHVEPSHEKAMKVHYDITFLGHTSR